MLLLWVRRYEETVAPQHFAGAESVEPTIVFDLPENELVVTYVRNTDSSSSSSLPPAPVDVAPPAVLPGSRAVRKTSQSGDRPAIVDECAAVWLPDNLVGRCFGLKDFFTYPELKHISSVDSSEECRALCCGMKSCVSWQYWSGLKICKLGGPARLGGEGGSSANWCEPQPPLRWSGQLKNKTASADRGAGGTCEWVKELPSQCFGLGMERKINNQPMTATQCQQSCCADDKCMMYQHADGKGCFHDSGGDGKNFCEGYMGKFEGGRKCRPQEMEKCPAEASKRQLRTNYY
jgi:hypothetical protein